MFREHKYKVWNGSRMILLADIANDTALWISEDFWEAVDHFTGSIVPLCNSDDKISVLLEYSGKNDIKRVNIYEGDIIIKRKYVDGTEITMLTEIVPVVFNTSSFGYIGRETNAFYPFVNDAEYDFEIIGNVFQHLHLLSDKQTDVLMNMKITNILKANG